MAGFFMRGRMASMRLFNRRVVSSSHNLCSEREAMRITFCVVVLFASLAALAAKSAITKIAAKEVGNSVLVIGNLGHPLGEEITIKGHKTENGKGDNCFDVEVVNGEKYQVLIDVSGIESWPNKTAATLRGYEEGYIRFLQEKETGTSSTEKFTSHQEAFVDFHVNSVIEPASLKLDK
jgi:hypothetical protein